MVIQSIEAASVPPATQLLRGEVRAFLDEQREAGAFVPAVDCWMSAPEPRFSALLGERGWIGMTIPTEYGGRGRGPIDRFVVTEELLAAGAPVAAHWIADRQMAPTILRNGTEQQRHRYLPGIAAGTHFFSIGMSEPDAGSDLAAVSMAATEHADGWRLSGTKVWTTGAHYAHSMIVLARTDPAAGGRQSGLSQFIVDLPTLGVQISPIHTIDGEHHFNEVFFDDALIPAEALLGVRGNGWQQVMDELAFERSGPERFLSTAPLLRRWAGTGPAGSEREFGRLAARVWALRQMSVSVAAGLATAGEADSGHREVQAAMVKDLGSQLEGEITDTVRRFTDHTDPGLATMLDAAIATTPVFTLRGGTNEILRSIVARGLGVR